MAEGINEEMSDEELSQKLAQLVGTVPTQEEKQNAHTFLTKVATSEDTTKLGNLRDDDQMNELGVPVLPLRTYKELQLFCEDIADMKEYASYFQKKGEILTATSLSRNAKLINLAVVQRREIADVTKKRKINKGWFKKKESPEQAVE